MTPLHRHRLRALMLVILLVALTGGPGALAQQSTGDVPTFQGGFDRTGAMPGPGPAPDQAVGERWRVFIGNNEASAPAVVGTTAYVGNAAGTLYALDLANGKQVWQHRNSEFISLPAVTGSQLFIVSGMSANAALTALDSASGTQSWTQLVSQLDTTAPVIAGSAVLVRTTDGRVLAFQG